MGWSGGRWDTLEGSTVSNISAACADVKGSRRVVYTFCGIYWGTWDNLINGGGLRIGYPSLTPHVVELMTIAEGVRPFQFNDQHRK